MKPSLKYFSLIQRHEVKLVNCGIWYVYSIHWSVLCELELSISSWNVAMNVFWGISLTPQNSDRAISTWVVKMTIPVMLLQVCLYLKNKKMNIEHNTVENVKSHIWLDRKRRYRNIHLKKMHDFQFS